MTYEELIELLSKDKELRIKRPDTRVLCNLHKDIGAKDLMPAYHPEIERIVIVRMSVKAKFWAGDYECCELMRIIPNGRFFRLFPKWKIVISLKKYGLSETKKRGETTLRAAFCGFWEEFGLYIDEKKLERLLAFDNIDKLHESSVYTGFLSQAVNEWVLLRLSERPWRSNRIFKDNGVWIYCPWFYRGPGREKRREKLIRYFLTAVAIFRCCLFEP